jgi:hypothetical protein
MLLAVPKEQISETLIEYRKNEKNETNQTDPLSTSSLSTTDSVSSTSSLSASPSCSPSSSSSLSLSPDEFVFELECQEDNVQIHHIFLNNSHSSSPSSISTSTPSLSTSSPSSSLSTPLYPLKVNSPIFSFSLFDDPSSKPGPLLWQAYINKEIQQGCCFPSLNRM